MARRKYLVSEPGRNTYSNQLPECFDGFLCGKGEHDQVRGGVVVMTVGQIVASFERGLQFRDTAHRDIDFGVRVLYE